MASPRVVWVALAVALALALPSLAVDRFGDDFAQLLAIEDGPPPFRGVFSRFDLFRFVDGNPDHTRRLMSQGALPWWTLPELRIAFWRPLSSALMHADHALFGRGTVGPHAHSILWSVALAGAVALLFRRLFPTALGGLALFLFVIDDARVLPTLWLANRNALVAGTFGVLGLWLHLRSREEQWAALGVASAACFAAALFAGEVALGLIAYLGAYELLGAPGTRAPRIRALLPVAVMGAAWFVAYKLLGYGGSGGSIYVDPAEEPLSWLLALLSRFPALAGAMLVGAPADAWMISEKARPVLVGAGVLAGLLFAWLLRAAWPQMAPEERRHTRWLLLGSALSILPVASTFPSSRLLMVPGIGAAVAIAIGLRHLWSRRPASRVLLAPRMALLAVLVLVHVIVAAAVWPVAVYGLRVGAERSDAAHAEVGRLLTPEDAPHRRLVLLWGEPFGLMNMGARWSLETRTSPKAWWLLSMAAAHHLYTRTGPATLELRLADGGRLLSTDAERFMRKQSRSLRQGDSVALDGLRVDVVSADERGVERLRFTFDTPLDDPSLVLLDWGGDWTLKRLPAPPIGAEWVVKPRPAH